MSWTVKDAGSKGGNARAAKLSKDRLAEIARKAGKASGKARRKLKRNDTKIPQLEKA